MNIKLFTTSVLFLSVVLTAPKATAGDNTDIARCKALLGRDQPQSQQTFDPSKPTIAIVGGYSTGRFAARYFRRIGIQTLHIHPHGYPSQPLYLRTFWPESFDQLDPYERPEDFEALIHRMKKIQLIGAFAAADSAVLFADRLTDRLVREGMCIPTNGIEPGRKDKFFMSELLAQAKPPIDSINQIIATTADLACPWIAKNRYFERNPGYVFVKPRDDGGGRSVSTISSFDALHSFFEDKIGSKNNSGKTNDTLLVQEPLLGTEYAPNAVVSGRVVFTGTWKHTKRRTPDGSAWVYDYEELIPFNGAIQQVIMGYHKNVLNAHRWNIGPSHPEIMLVPQRGPVLIESNYRFFGSDQEILVELATGQSQLDRTALAFTNPTAFSELPEGYTLLKHAFVYELKFFPNGPHCLRPEAQQLIENIPGVVHASLNYLPNQQVAYTRTLATAGGEVWLLHEDRDVLMASIDQLRTLEENGSLIAPCSR